MVDHVFPPAIGANGHVSISNALNYSSFTYWREPMPDVSFSFEDETKNTDTTNQQPNSQDENAKSETEIASSGVKTS